MNIYLGANSLTTSGGGTNKIILIITEDENLLGLTLNITGTSGTVYYNGLIAQEIYIEVPIGETLTTNEINGATKSLTVAEAGSRTWVLSHQSDSENNNEYTISLATIAVHLDDLIANAQVVISYNSITETYDWAGTPILTYIPFGAEYTISVSGVNVKSVEKTYTAKGAVSLSIPLIYRVYGIGICLLNSGHCIDYLKYDPTVHGDNVRISAVTTLGSFLIGTLSLSTSTIYAPSTAISTDKTSFNGYEITQNLRNASSSTNFTYNNLESLYYIGQELKGYIGSYAEILYILNNSITILNIVSLHPNIEIPKCFFNITVSTYDSSTSLSSTKIPTFYILSNTWNTSSTLWVNMLNYERTYTSSGLGYMHKLDYALSNNMTTMPVSINSNNTGSVSSAATSTSSSKTSYIFPLYKLD